MMAAVDHNTNLKRRTDSRLQHETKGLVLSSEAFQAYIISDDSELDALAVGVKWPAGQKWGSEDGFKIFVADVLRGVPSNDNCPDVVYLFPHGATADRLRSWAMTKQEIEATEARTGLKLADLRTLDEVVAFMELKSSRWEWEAAEAQVLRHLYRMTSTHPIRRWVFAATMCGCYLRVYVHTPAGIVHTSPINCASPNGVRILKRTVLRILNGDLVSWHGVVSTAATLPISLLLRDLPAAASTRLPNLPIEVQNLRRQYVDSAMFGPRPTMFKARLIDYHDDTTLIAAKEEDLLIIDHVDIDAVNRDRRIEELVDTARWDRSPVVSPPLLVLLDDHAYLSAPPFVNNGNAGCGLVGRASRYTIRQGRHHSILEIGSTAELVEFCIGIIEVLIFLRDHQIAARDLSIASVMVGSNNQGTITNFNFATLLDDESAPSELHKSMGILPFMAMASYPVDDTDNSHLPHKPWHNVENVMNTIFFVVSSRPEGPNGPSAMSLDARTIWTQWNSVDAAAAIFSKLKHYTKLGDHTNTLLYPTFWRGLPALLAILSKYCDLGSLPQLTETGVKAQHKAIIDHLRQQQDILEVRWGPNGDLSLDVLLLEMKSLHASLLAASG